jgi:Uncharacterized protein conserved in bacteria
MTYVGIDQIQAVAESLQDLRDQVVFVGGAITALLVDSVAAHGARRTEDIDFVIDLNIIGEFREFEHRMRALGFRHDQSFNAPICRWTIPYRGQNLIVDAMPADENVLGFSNRWYYQTIETAWTKELNQDLKIRVANPVYFLGTKIEAWHGRGKNDIFAHDLEDLFFVLEHRTGIELELYDAPTEIRAYLGEQCRSLLAHPGLDNSLPGIVDRPDVVKARLKFISSF